MIHHVEVKDSWRDLEIVFRLSLHLFLFYFSKGSKGMMSLVKMNMN